MAIEEVTVRRIVCDGCRKPIYIEGSDIPTGYSGTVTDPENRSTTLNWFACRDRCIRNAVVNVLI